MEKNKGKYEVQDPKIIQKPSLKDSNFNDRDSNLEELIQQTILKVAQRHSDAANSKDRISNASSNNTVIRTSFGFSKQQSEISNTFRESVLLSERQDCKELDFDDLKNDVEEDKQFFSPFEINKQQLQSKIYDQILSMPIDQQKGNHDYYQSIAGSKQSQNNSMSKLGSPDSYITQNQSNIPKRNCFDNKEINSIQSKPSMSIKNSDSGRKVPEQKQSVKSKASNMLKLESQSSIVSTTRKQQQIESAKRLAQAKTPGQYVPLKNRSPLTANRSPIPSRNMNVFQSGLSSLSYIRKSSQLKITTETPLENRKKSTYVSLIDKIESENQMKSKSKVRNDKNVFSKLTKNFNNISPSISLRCQESQQQQVSRNDVSLGETFTQSNVSYLKMYSQKSTIAMEQNKDVKIQTESLGIKSCQKDENIFSKAMSPRGKEEVMEEENNLTSRRIPQKQDKKLMEDLKLKKKSSSLTGSKTRLIRKKDQKPTLIRKSPDLTKVSYSAVFGQNQQRNIPSRLRSPPIQKLNSKELMNSNGRNSEVRKQSRDAQIRSVNRLFSNGRRPQQEEDLLSEILQYNNLNIGADESARSSMINTPYLSKVSSAAPTTLTMSQIKSGFERKVSKPSQVALDSTKRAQSSCSTKPNKKKGQVNSGFIPKSKEYLKNGFELEFWPIVHDIFTKEIDKKMTLMLDSKNLYTNDDIRMTNEQLFMNNFQSQEITSLKLKELNSEVEHRNENIVLKQEYMEEIILKMGFMRSKDNIEDKLEFIKLVEAMPAIQRKNQSQAVIMKKVNIDILNASNREIKKNDIINLDLVVMDSQYLNPSAAEKTSPLITEEESEETSSDDMDEPSAQHVRTMSGSKTKIQDSITIKTFLYCLLNILSIWTKAPKMPVTFKNMKQNRGSFYKSNVKVSVAHLQDEQVAEDNKNNIINQRQIQKQRSNGSISARQSHHNGQFGSQKEQEREYLAKQQDVYSRMLHMRPNEFFSSSLRTYAPPSLTKKKSPVKKRKSVDKVTSKHDALKNLKVPALEVGNLNTFSLRSLNLNKEQVQGNLIVGYNEALIKFEKKNAEIINTSRSKRSRDPIMDRRQNEDTVTEIQAYVQKQKPLVLLSDNHSLGSGSEIKIDNNAESSINFAISSPKNGSYASINDKKKNFLFDQYNKNVKDVKQLKNIKKEVVQYSSERGSKQRNIQSPKNFHNPPLTDRESKKDVNHLNKVIIKRQIKRYSLSPTNITSTFKEFTLVEIDKAKNPQNGSTKFFKTQLNDYTKSNPKPKVSGKEISLPFTPSMCQVLPDAVIDTKIKEIEDQYNQIINKELSLRIKRNDIRSPFKSDLCDQMELHDITEENTPIMSAENTPFHSAKKMTRKQERETPIPEDGVSESKSPAQIVKPINQMKVQTFLVQGNHEQITEAFREDSAESSDGLDNILNTQNEVPEGTFDDSQEFHSSVSEQEIQTYRSRKELMRLEMISDLKDEAQSFMKRQTSKDNSAIKEQEQEKVPKIERNSQAKSSKKQTKHSPSKSQMKEVISNLFKDDEGEEIEMNRMSRQDKQKSQIQKYQEEAKVSYKSPEPKVDFIIDLNNASRSSSTRKFVSKIARNNLAPVKEQNTQSKLSIPKAPKQQVFHKSRRSGGQPKQNKNTIGIIPTRSNSFSNNARYLSPTIRSSNLNTQKIQSIAQIAENKTSTEENNLNKQEQLKKQEVYDDCNLSLEFEGDVSIKEKLEESNDYKDIMVMSSSQNVHGQTERKERNSIVDCEQMKSHVRGISSNSSNIFKIQNSEQSIYKQTSQISSSQQYTEQKRDKESQQVQEYDYPLQPKKVIKFEIYVDEHIGTQLIEIYDKKHISENVERFALKFEIKSKSKISKLKKYIKSQFKNKDELSEI